MSSPPEPLPPREASPAATPPRRVHPRHRLLLVGAALLAAVLAFALAPTWLGLLLLAIAVGMGFDFPDPEESWSAQLAERRRREAAQRRTAVAAAPLRPCGSVRTPDGQLRPARSLRGFIAAGEPVEIVNEVDGTCIVLRLRPAPSDPTESSPA